MNVTSDYLASDSTSLAPNVTMATNVTMCDHYDDLVKVSRWSWAMVSLSLRKKGRFD